MMLKFLVFGAVFSLQLSGLLGMAMMDSDEYELYDDPGNDYTGKDQHETSREGLGQFPSLFRRNLILPPTQNPQGRMPWSIGKELSDSTSSTTEKTSTESSSSSEDVVIEPHEPIVIPVHKTQTELSNSVRVVGKMLSSEYLVTKGIGAHKLHLRRLSWNKARKVCIDEGGQLADISSDSEEKIILRMLNEESVEFAWVGFHDMFEEGDWVSVLGEPFGKSGWDRWWKVRLPNPDNSGPDDNEDCACLMRDGGGLNDNACAKELPFVCKITAL